MATKTTLQSVLGRHTEVLADFRKRFAEVQRERGIPTDTIVRQKTRLLEAIEVQIDDTQRSREAAVRGYDERIATLERRAESLKKEIEADRDALDPRGGPKPRPGIPGLGRATGGGAAKKSAQSKAQSQTQSKAKPAASEKAPSVTAIKGVGKAYADKLGDAGVQTPADLAKMKPAALGEALGISEDRAKKLVAAAKKMK
jgi:hypothetical protein